MKGNYFLRFPGGKSKALTFSYDDGVVQDIRLAEIFKKHRLKCTFNLNGGLFGTPGGHGRRITEQEAKELYSSDLFEVASHAYTHPWLEKCDSAVAFSEIVYDRRKLEELFGCQVHGMAYPFGTYSNGVLDICRSAGIYYSRTTQSHCTFKIPTDWLQWHPTCHHSNPQLFELADRFLESVPTRDPALFYVWGHSYEFDINDNWQRIEEFADKMAGKDDIWYATNMEIFKYCRSFSRFKYSADGSIIHNPTADEVWLCDGKGEAFSIKPGETVIR